MSVTIPDDLPTIQAALDSIWPGGAPFDTVLVRAGSYPERLDARSGVTVIGLRDGSGERPAVEALLARDGGEGTGFIRVRDMHFLGGVALIVTSDFAEFRDCQLDSGLICLLDYPGVLRLFRCAVNGRIFAYGAGNVEVDSCTTRGHIQVDVYDGIATIRDCEFTGPGAYAIWNSKGPAVIERNRVSGFDRGIAAGSENDIVVRDNVVVDCLSAGIEGDFDTGIIEGNRVERCGTGVAVRRSSGGALVRRNQIRDCSGDGIRMFGAAYRDEVDSNVVGRCGGDGISIVQASYENYGVPVHHNTSFGNGGSGLAMDSESGDPMVVSGNIAYGNGAYGLRFTGLVAPVASCNDWFANVAGAVGGMDSTGTGFSLWPDFCNIEAGNVYLSSSSPLLDVAGCGGIGALGVGCDVSTATLVTQFRGERTDDGIRIVWQVGPGATAVELWVERSDDGASGWSRVPTDRSRDGDAMVELDREARPDRAYWYQLVAREDGGIHVIGAPIRVEPEAPRSFDLVLVGPSPGSGAVRIEFRLARAAAVHLAVYDVLGREVATLADGQHPSGDHTVQWSGRDGRGAALPPGVYAVRYRHPEGQQVRRVLRSR